VKIDYRTFAGEVSNLQEFHAVEFKARHVVNAPTLGSSFRMPKGRTSLVLSETTYVAHLTFMQGL
jgi:hypothetical protein